MARARFCREVPLASVDLDDHPFAPGLPRQEAGLESSLSAVGMLSPPYLRPTSGGRWQVVTGSRRLRAARHLGWDRTAAFLLPPQTSEFACLLLSLHDNAGSRPLNPWEQAFYAHKLAAHLPREELVAKYLPLLGLEPAPRLLDRLLAAAALATPGPELLARGKLALSAAARLAAWPPEARRAALAYLAVLPFSRSKQEEFLDWVELLGRRQGLGAAALLSRPQLAACLREDSGPAAARAEAARRLLKSWVFPDLSRVQEAFQEKLRRLGLANHPRLALTPPPAFEGEDFSLTVRFRDRQELGSLLHHVADLLSREELQELLAL